MKREDLFEAVGDLDEALLDENVTELPKKPKFRWILPVAACLVLAAGVIAVPYAMRGGLPVGDDPTAPDATAPTEEQTEPPVIEGNPFDGLTVKDINEVYFEIDSMCNVVLSEPEIQLFLDRAQSVQFSGETVEQLSHNPYMQWQINLNDGTTTNLSIDQNSAYAYLNTKKCKVDESIEQLLLLGDFLMMKTHANLEPSDLSSLTAEDIINVNVTHLTEGKSVDLTPEQIETFLKHVSTIEVSETTNKTLEYDRISFFVTRKSSYELIINDSVDEFTNYETLLDFGYSVLQIQNPYRTTTFPILPPTEEWLGYVYFGSEFPYFIYGNDDYCVFTEGMDGLFIFDFNKGEITFSANITETFNKAGIAHGADAWNGVGLSAYRENGEVKLLCTASTGGDGTGTRGFTVDVENGTLTEIPNFDRNKLDFNVYVYNVPADGLPYLFGAAPIPLEDGYICFENSGLNNDVLPYEGSHLPMIAIRKVKGDAMQEWIPFKELLTFGNSGG